ncbi:DUF3025 domain-containing protein [Stenotrophomonas aracearum]|uniref:DUF3025 domain-containing protein n=1 Tax=Stenotrophomonas aracearum TaxID=3003272 RepID=A0ABY9YIN0_9GAMM|nr:DUF3025 domain-containing protein [Stenotrophomonas sp. A5588]WNH50691.1 DUF3025 domain-containing protein [Stenotrophomonas sp. A5588]
MAAARRRFVAPARDEVDRGCFTHALFAGMAEYHDLLVADAWPTVLALDERLALAGKRLVAQDESLLADGQHYEQRIALGRIATRAENWHDLFNALVWARYPAIKQALNARQCERIQANGPNVRDRAQAALTQFDETGVIVRVEGPAMLHAWDRHDWQALFVEGAAAWQDGRMAVSGVIGHALMEQALLPGRLLVGKCVVVQGNDDGQAVQQVAEAIERGDLLNDPLELRPLPLMGIPGWHARQDAAFFAQIDYFRPLRDGRKYPSIQSAR